MMPPANSEEGESKVRDVPKFVANRVLENVTYPIVRKGDHRNLNPVIPQTRSRRDTARPRLRQSGATRADGASLASVHLDNKCTV
jgi:hypothetical protein